MLLWQSQRKFFFLLVASKIDLSGILILIVTIDFTSDSNRISAFFRHIIVILLSVKVLNLQDAVPGLVVLTDMVPSPLVVLALQVVASAAL